MTNVIELGSIVIFDNDMYKVMWIYESGFCEIRKIDLYKKVELVELIDLKKSN
jgi:hypothetical protein